VGTSYSIVRLVFRPLTHVRRTICTSVSPSVLHLSFLWLQPAHAKFTIFRVPSYMLRLAANLSKRGRYCSPTASYHSPSFCTRVFHPNTRKYDSLLGPCYKTGDIESFRQHAERADGRNFARPLGDAPCMQTYTSSNLGPPPYLAEARVLTSTVQANVCNERL